MIQEVLSGIEIPWGIQILAVIIVSVCACVALKYIFRVDRIRTVLGRYPVPSLAAAAVLNFILLEIANHNVFFKTMSVMNIGINILTLFVLMLLIYAVCNRAWISIVIQVIVAAGLGIANYYTLHFRGTPVTAQDITSIGTAADVATDLDITAQIVVSFLLAVMICTVIYALYLRKFEVVKKRGYWRRALMAAAAFIFMWFIYFCSFSPKPLNTSAWIWRDQYWTYGYTASTVESFQRFFNIIEKPDGYTVQGTQEKMDTLCAKSEIKADAQKPDIILILNETFYNFRLIHDFSTDVAVTPYWDSLQNVIRGYVSVPAIGGSTNRSEYELLTSNSLYLMKDILPFWSLDMKEANSISTILQQQGYYTMAFHQGTSSNYNRDKKYVDMDFDGVYFEKDMDTYESLHGYVSDKSGYDFLIDKYEKRDSDKPFFAYNLTIQNHISDRDDVERTVHIQKGFDGIQDQVELYFSCLQKSDEAFAYLTDYFSRVDRPVVICMLGDHGPRYAADVSKKEGIGELADRYGDKCTPFLIWSNKGIKEEDWGIFSLPYLVPRLLDTAGVAISPYYQYLLDMQSEIPILTAYDTYADAEGKVWGYHDESQYQERILDYWYFEYFNVREKGNERFFRVSD